jgi:hypothetical protein
MLVCVHVVQRVNPGRAVVLETDGSFSVVRPGEGGNDPSLAGVNLPK